LNKKTGEALVDFGEKPVLAGLFQQRQYLASLLSFHHVLYHKFGKLLTVVYFFFAFFTKYLKILSLYIV